MVSAWRFLLRLMALRISCWREPVVVGEAFGIDQLGAELHQALLEALRLGDAAKRGDFPSFQ